MSDPKVLLLPRCRVGDRCWILGSDTANYLRIVRVISKGRYPEAPGEIHWLVESEGEPLIAYDAEGDAHYTMGCNVTDDELRPLATAAANDSVADAPLISLA